MGDCLNQHHSINQNLQQQEPTAMTTAAIIVAAGRGLRAGGGVAKQWRVIAGRAMIDHTITAFQANPQISRIVLVLHPDDEDRRLGFEQQGFIVALGGETRS
ncbi:MAG: 2-C-methyl-D-erythritol 4-phosphate cytidylyltransferase, partial [Paracoccaceae bacterium]